MSTRTSIRAEAFTGLIGTVVMAVRDTVSGRRRQRLLAAQLVALDDGLLDDIGMKRTASGSVLPLWTSPVPLRRSVPAEAAAAYEAEPGAVPIPVPASTPGTGVA